MRQVIFNYYVNKFGTSLFISQSFFTVYFGNKEKNAVTLPHSPQQKHAFLGKIQQMSKSQKLAPRKKITLELLHQRLGQRSTISLMDGDTEMFWKDVELGIDSDSFCTSCQISSMKKRLGLKSIKSNGTFQVGFYGYYSSSSTKFLTSDTTFLIIIQLLMHT